MSLVDIRIINLEELTADIERIRQEASFRWPEEILDGSAEMMKDEVRDQAPRGRTGELAESVQVEMMADARRVVVNSPHGRYVNDGTGPSPGRYVPAIGKRLINPPRGMHPGIRATHFFDRAVEMVTARILGFVHRKVYEYLME